MEPRKVIATTTHFGFRDLALAQKLNLENNLWHQEQVKKLHATVKREQKQRIEVDNELNLLKNIILNLLL